MNASIVEVIQHYQRSIDNSQENADRLLYCIKKLYKLPIKVEHLQETGVGKTVNSLRKFNGEIGIAAKTLVTKWKAMVAAEEEPLDAATCPNDNETNDNHNDEDSLPNHEVDGGEGEEDDELSGHTEMDQNRHHEQSCKENSNKHTSTLKHLEDYQKSYSTSSSRNRESNHLNSSHGSRSSNSKEREKEKTERKLKDHQKDKDLEKHKERSGKHREEKHKSERKKKNDSTSHKNSNSHTFKSKNNDTQSSSSLKDKLNKSKDRSRKHKSSSRDKDNRKQENSNTLNNNKHERKSSHKSLTKDSSAPPLDRKRRNTTSDSESNDFKSPQPKIVKVKRTREPSLLLDDDENNSFDSSMGANFGDILGMLNSPAKISKKSLKCSSSGSAKDSPKPSTSHSTASKTNGLKASTAICTPPSVTKLSTMKPDLLASSAKLAPLDPSIALELPTISTNYKPMPLNQTVMDCVYNTSSSSSSKPVRTLTDDEAYQHGISSKTMRTKIYSGVKTGQVMQVPTLFDMCIRILQKNIDALEYTGGVPFEVLRPVLERATPLQLFIFEDFNPYLMEDSDILWQTHVQRNYRTQKRAENESWREMFLRCQEEEDQRLSILKNTIKQSQKVAAAPVRKTQLAFIDTMVKPPRNVMRKQEQYGTKSKLVATPAARVASLQRVTPNAVKTGDQRLKIAPAVRDHAQVASSPVRPKKAPLMQKTLAFMRGRLKR